MTNFLVSSLLVLLSSGSNQDSSLSIKLELTLQKEYTVRLHKDDWRINVKGNGYDVNTDSVSQKRFDVQVDIHNTSKTPVYIWLMSCSWEANFLVNNNYIYIKGHDCDKNIPTIVEIRPGESKSYTTTLIKSIKFDYPPKNTVYGKQVETTKMGLIIVSNQKDKSIWDYDLLMEDRSQWQVVWSNPLYLLGKQPEPLTIDVIK